MILIFSFIVVLFIGLFLFRYFYINRSICQDHCLKYFEGSLLIVNGLKTKAQGYLKLYKDSILLKKTLDEHSLSQIYYEDEVVKFYGYCFVDENQNSIKKYESKRNTLNCDKKNLLLQQAIGKTVTIEMLDEVNIHSFNGILFNFSKYFYILKNTQVQWNEIIHLEQNYPWIEISYQAGHIELKNISGSNLYLSHIESDDFKRDLYEDIQKDQFIKIPLDPKWIDHLKIFITRIRVADVIISRKLSRLRMINLEELNQITPAELNIEENLSSEENQVSTHHLFT